MTMLVVDEAQGIRDGSRGVLLQTGVEQAIHKCPDAAVVFASPLISNPEYFLEAFSAKNGYSSLERHSPVGQNFIIVEPSKRNSSHLEFSLLKRGSRVPLSVREVKPDFGRSMMLKQRALLASLVTGKTDSCLVYSKGTYEAEELARQLVLLRPDVAVGSEVTDFIAYIEEHIHPEYPLIDALKKGVAFHHGDMPASVRGGVEDLFRQQKLQFICCTSTLLQGVNLPARHLVIDRPQKGNNIALAPADFLNLAGRAGRLGREFNGNVWCLNASKWRNQPQDQTDLPRVESSFKTALHENPGRLSLVLEQYEKRLDPDGVVTASLGRLLTEYIFSGRMPDLPADEGKRAQLLKAIDALRGLKLNLPHEVFIRNSTLLPTTLERLYVLLLSKENIDEWIPPHPKNEEFYGVLLRILELLQTEVEGRKGFSFRFDAVLACKWIRQMSLRQMIESSLAYYKSKQIDREPQEVIRQTIQAVEKRLRFELVRGLRAYQTVLAEVLKTKGRAAEAESLLPLHLYVECGGYKHSLLSAMSLGFSRTSSLILLELLPLPDDATPEQLRERILRCDLAVAKVPEVVQREIHQLLGKATKGPRSKLGTGAPQS